MYQTECMNCNYLSSKKESRKKPNDSDENADTIL